MSNEIQLYAKLQDPIGAIERIGKMFSKSGMFGCDKEEQGQVLAMICLSENKSPVAITRTFHIVEGKLSKKALAQLAEFRAAGGKHKWIQSGDEPAAKDEDRKASGEFTDKEGNRIAYSYSIADAKTEGLYKEKSRWVKRPGNMLRARCITNALGMLMPEIVAGEFDDDSDVAVAPTLDLGAKVETTSKVNAPIEVQVVVEPAKPKADAQEEAELAAAGLAPAQPATTVAASTPPQALPAFEAAEASPGVLSAETLVELQKRIGTANEAAVFDWLTKSQWITGGQMHTLKLARARQIINHPESFLVHCGITK